MKKLLLETSIPKIYMLGMILLSLLLVGGYYSYALFTVNKEKSNAISIVTGNLTVETLVDGEKKNTLDVEANRVQDFVVTLNSQNERLSRVNFYYQAPLPEGVEVGYIVEEGKNIPPKETGINLTEQGSLGSSQVYKIRVRNKSTKKVSITIGSEIGLDYNDLTLPKDGHLFEEMKIMPNSPVLGSNMIPVKYEEGKWEKASTNNWYNYDSKEWANAVILVDHPSKSNYEVGEEVNESDIESYFVWIPRFKYQLFAPDNYNEAIEGKIENSNVQIIDIVFQEKEEIKENGDEKGEWLTHPAFTLGGVELSGIWVGKFETGYNQNANIGDSITNTDTWTKENAQHDDEAANKIIIKPNVYSWRGINVYHMFMNAYNYERSLDSHMMKNTEWGAVSYLSHSKYGIEKEVNVNNNSELLTGYSATENADQSDYPGITGTKEEPNLTLPYDTPTGYLASTNGNITGIYDMSGGSYEYVAAYQDQYGAKESGFITGDLTLYVDYLDVYKADNNNKITYNNCILGDATGEMGPFYYYPDGDKVIRNHNAWYADDSNFIYSSYPWFRRGGVYDSGILAGQFYFGRGDGNIDDNFGSRLVLSPEHKS